MDNRFRDLESHPRGEASPRSDSSPKRQLENNFNTVFFLIKNYYGKAKIIVENKNTKTTDKRNKKLVS